MTFLKSTFFLSLCLYFSGVVAQKNAFVHEGELGVSLGAAHYFGDINMKSALNRPRPAVGIFFRKQFGNYVSLRLSGHLAKVGYADKYSTNDFQRQRNLSFNSDIKEVALQADFNFFKFLPARIGHRFTPYFTLGIGVFDYNPYAFFTKDSVVQKHFLRGLATERVDSNQVETYGRQAVSFPIGLGVKFNIWRNINLGFEITHRFTTTDHLDDVSARYSGEQNFLFPEKPDYILQDRSLTLPRIGVAGSQRGFSAQKDQYIFAEFTLTFSFTSYSCADPR